MRIQLGRLTHYAFDAVLISAFLAGVRRSTGLTYVILFRPLSTAAAAQHNGHLLLPCASELTDTTDLPV